MGKISAALERYKEEISIKVEGLSTRDQTNMSKKGIQPAFNSELNIQETFSSKLVVFSAPESLDAENFKILRAQVLFPKNGEISRTIMVTSAYPGEGKTFVAANLAVSIAQGVNEYVLLIDCDLRNPKLHEMLGCSNKEGLHEYLKAKRKLPDLIIQTKIKKLSLLTAGSLPHNPAELLSSITMKHFLREVKERYQDRFIIIDATPCQFTAEAGVLANFVDGIIFVVMAQKSPRESIQGGIENIGKNKILGVVFNGYSKAHKRYRQYYKKQ